MLSEKSKHLINNYKDRGMIKWQPFIALETQQEYIDNLVSENNKQKKPVISSAQVEVINNNLTYAIKHKSQVLIKYFKNSKTKTLIGKITNFNKQNKTLTVNTQKINMNNVLDILL